MDAYSLLEAKEHLRVDHNYEDDAILAMLNAAAMHAANYLNSPDGTLSFIEDDDGVIPAPVRSALLLMVGDLYANREAQGERQLFRNHTFYRLLDPYRVMEA